MPATDDVKTVEDRLWALLRASADWVALVKNGNQVAMNDTAKQRDVSPKGAKRTADFAEVTIDRGRHRYRPFTGNGTVTFCTAAGGSGPRIMERSQDFVITIATDDQGSVVAGQVLAETEAAIVAGGSRLGIPTVVTMLQEISGGHEIKRDKQAAGTMRRVVTVTATVLMRKSVPGT